MDVLFHFGSTKLNIRGNNLINSGEKETLQLEFSKSAKTFDIWVVIENII